MTTIEKLRRIADMTALEGVADAIREVADEMDWRPIETAPKDADVWVYGKARVWVDSCEFWWQGQAGWAEDDQSWWTTSNDDKGGQLKVKPTNWMPLPPAPKGAE